MERSSNIGPDFDLPLELGDWLEENVVTIPCYEPSSECVQISGRALTTHTLLLGQTGSGKTTSAMRWFLKSLIQHGRSDSSRRPGVFVFDLNGDSTLGLVRKWAADAGRSEDVRLLTTDSGHLDVFANVRTFEDLPSATAQFMHGGWIDDSVNGYWHETTRTLIDAALSICLAVHGRLETDIILRFLTNWLIAKRPSQEDEALLSGFAEMASAAPKYVDKHLVSKIHYVRATVEMWSKLDSKTKSILNSCLLDAIGPLISMETRPYLDNSRGPSFVPEEIILGRIMVFSLPAGRNLESATLLGRLIKSRLYLALQNRPQQLNQRLCAVLADEYHYLANGGKDRSSDVTALATLRSRSTAVIAATQSLNHLASVMSTKELRSLLPNFGNHFFFRSTEDNTGAFATSVMGTRDSKISRAEESGDLIVGVPPIAALEYVCPPGALARLEACQAYVAMSTGYRSPGMIWLGANHEVPSNTIPHRKSETSLDSMNQLRDFVFAKPHVNEKFGGEAQSGLTQAAQLSESSPRHLFEEPIWNRLVRQRRFERSSFRSFQAFRQAFADCNQHPAGLETLPLCWWNAVVNVVISFCKRDSMKLIRLEENKGCLEVLLSGGCHPTRLYLEWIARLQRSVYPSRLRRLKTRDRRLIESWAREESFPPDAEEHEHVDEP